MAEFFSKVAGVTEAAADTDLCNTVICVAELIGRLRKPVKGQIFHGRLTGYLLKTTETFCPADVCLPGHIFYSNILLIAVFYIFQYLFHPFFLFCTPWVLYIDSIFRPFFFRQKYPCPAQFIPYQDLTFPFFLSAISIYPFQTVQDLSLSRNFLF